MNTERENQMRNLRTWTQTKERSRKGNEGEVGTEGNKAEQPSFDAAEAESNSLVNWFGIQGRCYRPSSTFAHSTYCHWLNTPSSGLTRYPFIFSSHIQPLVWCSFLRSDKVPISCSKFSSGPSLSFQCFLLVFLTELSQTANRWLSSLLFPKKVLCPNSPSALILKAFPIHQGRVNLWSFPGELRWALFLKISKCAISEQTLPYNHLFWFIL